MTSVHASRLRAVRAILFDLDGTLLDSFQSHFRVYSRLFAELKVPFDEATYLRHYSPNWYVFYERMGLPNARWAEADRLWLQHYAREAPKSRDGGGEVLAAVKASGRALGLVTSGDRSRVERDLDRMGWAVLFDVVVCGGDVPERKPHPAALMHALRRLDVRASEALYVGDTVEDVAMGKAAGVIMVAVLSAFASREELSKVSPHFLLETLRDLTPLL